MLYLLKSKGITVHLHLKKNSQVDACTGKGNCIGCLWQHWWHRGESSCLPGQQHVQDIMGCKTHLVVCSVALR